MVTFKGIETYNSNLVYNFRASILYGKAEFESTNPIPAVIIGLQLADQLQSIVGDTLTLISPVGIEKAITQLTMPLTKKVIISGIYRSNNNDYDERYIIGDLEFTQFVITSYSIHYTKLYDGLPRTVEKLMARLFCGTASPRASMRTS